MSDDIRDVEVERDELAGKPASAQEQLESLSHREDDPRALAALFRNPIVSRL